MLFFVLCDAALDVHQERRGPITGGRCLEKPFRTGRLTLPETMGQPGNERSSG